MTFLSKTDRVIKYGTAILSWSIVAITAAVGVMLVYRGWPVFKKVGLLFFIHRDWDPVFESFGALPFIYGTLASALIALLIAVPLSLGIAIFLSELAPARIRTVIGFLVELLAAIPSVIYGLWGIFFLIPWLRETVEPAIITLLGTLPLPGGGVWTVPFFQGPPYGIGLFAASLILAIMIIPVIAAISRDVLQAVPMHQREAALALGATRWEMTRIAVVRYARSGIIGAVFLGLGRALGETMAVTMLIGNRPDISLSIFAPAHTMASVIANEFTEATGDLYPAALMAIGATLFLITLIVNALARVLVLKVGSLPKGGAL